MATCYRGMPKFIGAFFDALYQYPMISLIAMAGITALAGFWWHKVSKKAQTNQN
jgi:hypothetical protein